MLGKICEPKKNEAGEHNGTLHNRELHDSHWSPKIVSVPVGKSNWL